CSARPLGAPAHVESLVVNDAVRSERSERCVEQLEQLLRQGHRHKLVAPSFREGLGPLEQVFLFFAQDLLRRVIVVADPKDSARCARDQNPSVERFLSHGLSSPPARCKPDAASAAGGRIVFVGWIQSSHAASHSSTNCSSSTSWRCSGRFPSRPARTWAILRTYSWQFSLTSPCL